MHFSISTLLATATLTLALSNGSSHSLCHGSHAKHCGTPRANFTFDEMWHLQTRFWDNFVYNNSAQTNSINSTLLAPDVLGRVDATRTFDGQELNTEYLFGLFANLAASKSVSLLGVPVSYNIIHFAANQDVSSAATVVTFKNAFMGEFPVEIDSWITWDTKGRIWQYDATYRWFDFLLDTTFKSAMPLINATTTAEALTYFTGALATGICNTAQTYCNGTNAQFDSFASCYAYLTTEVRFGTAYGLGQDTLLCRMVHENMVPLRPDVHCPHIGKSGGGMCVDDMTYVQKVQQPYFTNAPMVPYGYQNKNATIAAM